MIYLDNNATTHTPASVIEEMTKALALKVGNPSSPHSYGREARALFQQSLSKIAKYFGVKENQIILTSGATEALNLLILGFAKPGHIITSQLEHVAVLQPIQKLEKNGWRVTYLAPKEGRGAVSLKQVEESIRPDTTLIVLMGANNETGVMTEIDAIGELALRRGIHFLVDGVALLGKTTMALHPGVSAICFSGHKIHAPPGIGFAVVRNNFPFEAQIVGGPQQRGKRGGTENLPALVALAKAIELLDEESISCMHRLRDKLEEGIVRVHPGAYVHSKDEKRVCNTSNICFPHIDGEALLIHLDQEGIAVSLGSACSSGSLAPSKVLLSMGVEHNHVRSSLRFSLSRYTTEEEIETVIKTISRLIN